MNYMRITAAGIEYPFALQTLQVENPNTSFPELPSDEVLASFGVYSVVETDPLALHVGVDAVHLAPELVNGLWQERWELKPVSEEEYLSRLEGLCGVLDDSIAAIYASVGRFSEEYKSREQQAQEFQAKGYTGEVPRQVAAFANRAELPAKDAANIILGQAQQFRAALDDLGDLRMLKCRIRITKDPVKAQEIFDQAMAQVTGIGQALA